ncbi:TPA: CRISPR-associated endonuclease Cas1 [Streptococcus suis]|nr:CRISPR-associated endonuclease Cas1 [Streptococcus suis]
MLKKSGGKRLISSFSTVDRFILRLLSQKLNRYLDPMFLEHSYAYREGKGVLAAVMQARAYIQEGASYLVEIYLHQYFDTIPLERLYELLTRLFSYQAVLDLLRHYLYCQVSFEGRIVERTKGLIQGSAIGPVLSNLYLLDLDMYMETKGMNWMRFADNIYLFCKRREEAEALYSDVVSVIETQFSLTINQKKSGVFRALQHRMSGYDFIMKEGEIHCQKHHYRPVRYYPTWHQSPLRFVNQQYHIVEGGILTKKDFSLLFETEEYRYHLSIEVIEQIDIYSDVFVSPTTLTLLAEKRIPLVIHNRFGQIQSYFIPESMKSRAPIVLAQYQLYQDEARRLMIAKKIEEAHLHNLRANCRYYQKKHPQPELDLIEEGLTGLMKDIHSKQSVQELMLLEGRAR